MRPRNADGFRQAWTILDDRWTGTLDRARLLPPEVLHERVNGEWSFIETLRHLVFATDAWLNRAVLGDPTPWDRLGLPHDEMVDEPTVPRDLAVRPTLDEVLVVRKGRAETVRRFLAELSDDDLERMTEPVTQPGYPAGESYLVRRCLEAILIEEWEHRLYAERDLDALTAQSAEGR